jgi:hypothetical protein
MLEQLNGLKLFVRPLTDDEPIAHLRHDVVAVHDARREGVHSGGRPRLTGENERRPRVAEAMQGQPRRPVLAHPTHEHRAHCVRPEVRATRADETRRLRRRKSGPTTIRASGIVLRCARRIATVPPSSEIDRRPPVFGWPTVTRAADRRGRLNDLSAAVLTADPSHRRPGAAPHVLLGRHVVLQGTVTSR